MQSREPSRPVQVTCAGLQVSQMCSKTHQRHNEEGYSARLGRGVSCAGLCRGLGRAVRKREGACHGVCLGRVGGGAEGRIWTSSYAGSQLLFAGYREQPQAAPVFSDYHGEGEQTSPSLRYSSSPKLALDILQAKPACLIQHKIGLCSKAFHSFT